MGTGLPPGDALDTPEPRMLLRRLMAQVSRSRLMLGSKALVRPLHQWERMCAQVHLYICACIHSCSSRKIWQCSFSSWGSSRAARYGHGCVFEGVLADVDLVWRSESSSLLV